MSRIGLKVINVPAGVTLTQENGVMTVKGPKGELKVNIPEVITVTVDGATVSCARANDEKHTKQLHGTTRANLHNAIVGVSEGFKKELVMVGIGFRAQMRGNNVVVKAGYSHEVTIVPDAGAKIACTSDTEMVVEGIDKQAVGQTAARIRAIREPEPYNGKGIMYKGEHIIRKEGKRAGAK